MSGPKRNPDRLNTIGVVVVGICGAVLVYVSIVALQAFYLDDTSEIQTMADYGGNDVNVHTMKTAQIQNIIEYGSNPAAPGKAVTYRTPIEVAMKHVVDAAKVDPAALVPAVGRSDKATVQPVFGRPIPVAPPTAPTAPAGGAGSGSAAGTGSAAGSGAGSAASLPPAPQTPTGGQAQGGSTPTGGTAGSAAKGNGP